MLLSIISWHVSSTAAPTNRPRADRCGDEHIAQFASRVICLRFRKAWQIVQVRRTVSTPCFPHLRFPLL